MAPDAAPGVVELQQAEIAAEDHAIKYHPHWRARRVAATTAVFVGLWAGSILFVHAGQSAFAALFLLVPLYLVTLPLVLRTPKRYKRYQKPKSLAERLNWQARLMIACGVFLALYVPFSIFSNAIIPYAPIFEYFLFTLTILLLLRLAGRSLGVAPSLDALPHPTHRIHQQVVTPIDDPHYQKTLMLNYGFVEKGRGHRALAKRLETLLGSNGVPDDRRTEILRPLEAHREPFGWALTRRGRERRRAGRDLRGQTLESVFATIQRELETRA